MIADTYTPVRVLMGADTVEVSFAFPILAEANLRVYLEDPDTGEQVLQESGFTVEYDDDTPGGTVTFAETHEGDYCVIGREIPRTQESSLTTSGGLQLSVVEYLFDKLTAIVQDVREMVARSIKIPMGSTAEVTLPTPQDGYTPTWDGDDGAMKNVLVDADAIASAVSASAASAAAASSSASAAANSADDAAESAASIPDKASQAEAEAGTADDKYMTPLKTAEAIAAQKPGFGSWVTKSHNTVYLAATDGLLVAWSGSATAFDISLYTDAANPPTIVRSESSSKGGAANNRACVMSPVKKGDYYKVYGTVATSYIFFLPLGA